LSSQSMREEHKHALPARTRVASRTAEHGELVAVTEVSVA
jgi:hypothetical protein